MLRSRLTLAFALSLATACHKPAADAVPAEPESEPAADAAPSNNEGTATPAAGTTQIANPASVHCEQQGGKLEIERAPDGERGICVLPDGTRCEEWAYMRGECPKS